MKRLLSYLILAPVFALALLPLPVLYLFANVLAAALYHVIGYRKKLIISQLSVTFPEKSEAEIRLLTRKFYLNLADLVVEAIKGFMISEKELIRRVHYVNPEVVTSLAAHGRSVIVCAGHYTNWEWMIIAPKVFNMIEVVLYAPIKNPVVDHIMRRTREQFGASMFPITHTAEVFQQYHNKGVMFALAGDQSPSSKYISNSHWLPFLGRDTAFLTGIARYAQKYDLPVVFLDTQRLRRGYYESTLELLTDSPRQLAEHEITERYARRLEAQILARPEHWLWSHRRWKFSRETETPAAPQPQG